MQLNNVYICIVMPTTINKDCPYICKSPALAINNKQFNGNTNSSSKTRAMRYSEIVRIGGSRYGRVSFINNPNAYIIEPPRNTF
jgi:hypothetical protein